jgi:hypothetical protein
MNPLSCLLGRTCLRHREAHLPPAPAGFDDINRNAVKISTQEIGDLAVLPYRSVIVQRRTGDLATQLEVRGLLVDGPGPARDLVRPPTGLTAVETSRGTACDPPIRAPCLAVSQQWGSAGIPPMAARGTQPRV